MTSQCPRCAAPRLTDNPFCPTCGLDFRTVVPTMPDNSAAPPTMPATQQPAGQPVQPVQQPGQPVQQPGAYQGPTPGYCPRCNAPLYPGYTVCGNCGLDTAPYFAARPKNRALAIILAGGLVFALVLAGVAVVAMSKNGGSSSSPSTSGTATIVDPSEVVFPTPRPLPTGLETPPIATPDSGSTATSVEWLGSAAGGMMTIMFTVEDNVLSSVIVGFVDSAESVHMWMSVTVPLVNNSFDIYPESVTGEAGETFELKGAFTGPKAVSGTYVMTIGGTPQSGPWSATPIE